MKILQWHSPLKLFSKPISSVICFAVHRLNCVNKMPASKHVSNEPQQGYRRLLALQWPCIRSHAPALCDFPFPNRHWSVSICRVNVDFCYTKLYSAFTPTSIHIRQARFLVVFGLHSTVGKCETTGMTKLLMVPLHLLFMLLKFVLHTGNALCRQLLVCRASTTLSLTSSFKLTERVVCARNDAILHH